MKDYFRHWWTVWFLAIGLIWIVGLTAFNIYYNHYGWFIVLNSDGAPQTEWNREEVGAFGVAVSKMTSLYVAQQILPIFIIGIGFCGHFFQRLKEHKMG